MRYEWAFALEAIHLMSKQSDIYTQSNLIFTSKQFRFIPGEDTADNADIMPGREDKRWFLDSPEGIPHVVVGDAGLTL